MTTNDFIAGMTNNEDVQRDRRILGWITDDDGTTKIWDGETTRLATLKWNRLVQDLHEIVEDHAYDKEVIDEINSGVQKDAQTIVVRELLKAVGLSC
jgi:hypothetical protein